LFFFQDIVLLTMSCPLPGDGIALQASCTLEAGVKIYSCRVDSIHSETFKVLNGLNRTALPGTTHPLLGSAPLPPTSRLQAGQDFSRPLLEHGSAVWHPVVVVVVVVVVV